MAGGLPQRIDRVDRRSGMRERHCRVGRPEQGRGCYGHVRIRPGKRWLTDSLQFLLQIQGNITARADAVYVDPARPCKHVDHLDERADIEIADGVRYGLSVGMPDLPRDHSWLIARKNVMGWLCHSVRSGMGGRSSQANAQLRIATQPERSAEPDHGRRRSVA